MSVTEILTEWDELNLRFLYQNASLIEQRELVESQSSSQYGKQQLQWNQEKLVPVLVAPLVGWEGYRGGG